MSKMQNRSVVLDPGIIDEGTRSIRVVLATEEPAVVMHYNKGRFELIREVLMVPGMKVPENGQLPLIDNHDRFDNVAETLKGSVREITVENNELTGRAYFSSLSEKEWLLAKEGHLTDVSIGYEPDDETSVVVTPGAEQIIGGRAYKNDYPDNLPLYIRQNTYIKELSLVVIGADKKAKFRSEPEAPVYTEEQIENSLEKILTKHNITITEKGHTMPEKTQEEIVRDEQARVSALYSLYNRYEKNYTRGKAGLEEAIQKNLNADQFANDIFNHFNDAAPVETPVSFLDMGRKDVQRFSISRAIGAIINNSWKDAQFEKEVVDLTRSRLESAGYEGKGANSFFLPYDLQKRTMITGTANIGGDLVGTDHLGSEFIEYLRNKSFMGFAGVRMLSGLRGNVQIPKQTAGATAGWNAETSVQAAADLTLSQVDLSPKELDAAVQYSRKLFLQSNPSIDAIIMDDIYKTLMLGVEVAALHGAGGSAPTGVANTSGVGSVTGTGLDWDGILEFEEDIAVANADMNTLKWLATPGVRRLLKGRFVTTGVAERIWAQDNTINGYAAMATNQVSSGYLFFGDWSQIFVGEWGALEFVVDAVTNAKVPKITGIVSVDIGVRQAGAFSVASGVN